jgi:DNA replication and repair protein RecF
VEARLIRFGADGARVALRGHEAAVPVETEVTLVPGEGKRIRLNGAAVAGADALRTRLTALVFTPDRLAVVKGGPLVRRSYVDRMLGRVFPPRAPLPGEYAAVLGQRNAALRRVRAGGSTVDAIEPWTRQLAALGSRLDAARAELVALLGPPFAAYAGMLGLEAASVTYEDRGLAVSELAMRLARDVERGTTGVGPHLRDIEITAGGRDLRSFGSQGEQRAGVLALVLAEASVLVERRGAAPLLLLDDVLSELDEDRREAFLAALPVGAQALVTATESTKWPAPAPEPAAVVTVARARETSVAEVR